LEKREEKKSRFKSENGDSKEGEPKNWGAGNLGMVVAQIFPAEVEGGGKTNGTKAAKGYFKKGEDFKGGEKKAIGVAIKCVG